jgi:hypothetical protein
MGSPDDSSLATAVAIPLGVKSRGVVFEVDQEDTGMSAPGLPNQIVKQAEVSSIARQEDSGLPNRPDQMDRIGCAGETEVSRGHHIVPGLVQE